MAGLEIAVLIGALLVLGGYLGRRLRLPAPLVHLALGVGCGFVPAFDPVALPPELVLLLFLPALLYWEAINISLREARRNLRVVLQAAIPLVLVTVAAVAGAGSLIALPAAVAVTLGAIVAPTDASAVGAVAGELPRRTKTVLRAESLINDGTALAVYGVAVGAVLSDQPISFGTAALRFLASYAGGLGLGLVVGLAALAVRRVVAATPVLSATTLLLTPFAAYLPAELLDVSGVIAVVTAGLLIAWAGPRTVLASTRVQSRSFWELTTWMLNGTLFLLIGFETHRVLPDLGTDPFRLIILGVVTTVLLVVVRVAWVLLGPSLVRLVIPRAAARGQPMPLRYRLVDGWAGFRGAVSWPPPSPYLAISPYRAELVVVTLIVVLVTLVVSGLTLPAMVRWSGLPPDPSEAEEQRMAERVALEAGLAALPATARRLGVRPEVADRVEQEYRGAWRRLVAGSSSEAGPPGTGAAEADLRRALVAAKRRAVIRLRDAGELDDAVLRSLQIRLDLEELDP